MKKLTFGILLCTEWIFGTVILEILLKPSYIYSLLMIGINALLVWVAAVPICRLILRRKTDTAAFMKNGILTLNAAVLLVMYILKMMIVLAI